MINLAHTIYMSMNTDETFIRSYVDMLHKNAT